MNPIRLVALLSMVTCAGLLCLPASGRAPVSLASSSSASEDDRPPQNPISAIHNHLGGFHFYSGDLNRSLRVEHYCSHLNEDVFQCVIYDSDKPNARLIGVEYIISEALFVKLPAEEKKLWHSHRYEVMSGLLSAPDLTPAAERELMRGFVSTYGKTWHLWQVDRGDPLPLGLPQLMMGFTAEGQVDPELVAERDRDQHLDSAKIAVQRADLPTRPVAAGADAWEHGPAFQIHDSLPVVAPDARHP